MEHRFEHKHAEQQATELHGRVDSGTRSDFERAEDLLRADRERVDPPAALRDRLAASGAAEGLEGGGTRPWWRRLLGR